MNGGGWNHYNLIDIEGKVVDRGGSEMWLYVSWMNATEQSIHNMLDKDGKYSGEKFTGPLPFSGRVYPKRIQVLAGK